MRASRLVSLLLLLQHRGRVTAAEAAAALEVSVRTIYRDLEALGAAGVPVYTEPGRNGGIALVDGYRTRLTGLTTKEAQALFAAGVSGPAGELGLGTVLGAAQLKLLAALPKELGDQAASASQRFHVDAPGWFRAERTDPHLAELAAAVWEDHVVHVLYRRAGDDEPTPRELEPLGLVSKGGVWYLVARRDAEPQAIAANRAAVIRTYRVSRITDVRRLDATFERPADFDLGAWWRTSVAEYETVPPPIEVDARARPRVVEQVRGWNRHYGPVLLHAGEVDADGWVPCTFALESVDDAAIDLLRFGADVEVLTPTELRDTLRATARAMADLYLSEVPV